MPLTLIITSYAGRTRPSALSKSFDQEGGTIGRVLSNTLVLPDPLQFVSKTHARIDFWDGSYFVTHLGTNPTELNGQPLEKDSAAKLSHGDNLSIGEYVIQVEIGPSTKSTREPAEEQRPATRSSASLLSSEHLLSNSMRFLDVPLNGDAPDTTEQSQPATGLASSSNIQADWSAEHEKPRSTPVRHRSNSADVPRSLAAYNPLTDDDEQTRPNKDSAATGDRGTDRAHTGAAGAESLDPRTATDVRGADVSSSIAPQQGEAAGPNGPSIHDSLPHPSIVDFEKRAAATVLNAAGLPELGERLKDYQSMLDASGRLLREAIEGLHRVMMSRAMIKRELRVDTTMIAAAENNPLKALPNAKEVLAYFFAPHERSGYLPPLQAVHDSFEDIETHNAAVIAGMRDALQSVLKRFNPNEIEKRLTGKSLLENVLPSQRKARMWDLMSQMHDQVCKEAEDDFDRHFGAIFGHAYMQEVGRLRASKRDGSKK